MTGGQESKSNGAAGEWLSVERWVNGDTEERNPMYCLYLEGPKVNAGLGWLRIGDVWDQDGADYLNALVQAAARVPALEMAYRQATRMLEIPLEGRAGLQGTPGITVRASYRRTGMKRWQKFALTWLMFSGPTFGILAALVKDWLF